MRIGRRLPSKTTLFVILMVAAALASLLPPRWTGWARAVTQPLGWLQWGTSSAGRKAERAAEDAFSSGRSASDFLRLRTVREELERKLAHQARSIALLEEQLAAVTGLRNQLRDDRRMIVVAAVVAYDADARRETLTISKGSLAGVRPGQWVAAGAGSEQRSPHETGSELLARQWLIGQVSEVWPYESRVRLATDAQFGPVAILPARVLADGTWQPVDNERALYGQGRGQMLVREAKVDAGAGGARVVLVPPSADLPASLTLGRIVTSESVPESGLHFNLKVAPWGDARKLDYVYVVATRP